MAAALIGVRRLSPRGCARRPAHAAQQPGAALVSRSAPAAARGTLVTRDARHTPISNFSLILSVILSVESLTCNMTLDTIHTSLTLLDVCSFFTLAR